MVDRGVESAKACHYRTLGEQIEWPSDPGDTRDVREQAHMEGPGLGTIIEAHPNQVPGSRPAHRIFDRCWAVAQRVEPTAVNRVVAGSRPARPANYSSGAIILSAHRRPENLERALKIVTDFVEEMATLFEDDPNDCYPPMARKVLREAQRAADGLDVAPVIPIKRD